MRVLSAPLAVALFALPLCAAHASQPVNPAIAIVAEDPACKARTEGRYILVACTTDEALAKAADRLKNAGGFTVSSPLCTTLLEGSDAGIRRCELLVEQR